MKTLFKSFALVAIAALSLAACSKNEASINDENDLITLKFNIKNADDATTRALLAEEDGKKFLNWENGDKIGTFSVGSFSSDQTTSNNNGGTVEVSGENYTLNVQTFNAGTVTNIYSYFPYSAAAGKDKTAAVISIPSNQFMNADGFDADAMPMAGTPITVDLTTVANTDTPCGTINFSNLGSIINFKIYSSTETDETLTSVKYIAGTGNLGGSYAIDLTAVDGADETTLALIGDGSESEITTTHRATPVIGTGKANAIDVYMVVAPGSYSGTQVVVTTSAKTYTLTASGTKTYTRSSVKPMYVDIQNGTQGDLPAEETWTKVTKASDFTAGTYYILRADGAGYVSNAKATNAPPVFVSYAAGDPVTADMRWIATNSGSGLVFESAANEGFTLGSSNIDGKANTTRVTDSYSGTSARNVWSFETITVSGNTYYTATLGSSKYLVSYGTTDWRYYGTSNINDTNIPAEFYKLDVVDDTPSFSVDSPLAATANEDTYTVNVNRNNFTGAITVTVPSDCDWVVADDIAENEISFDVLVSENTGSARTVTLTLTGSGVESQELVINQAGVAGGTESNPYTVAEAFEAASALSSDQSVEDVYVKGYISSITYAYSSTSNNLSFNISDDGLTTGNQLNIYKFEATSATDYMVGDFVEIKGTLKNYNGTKPEIDEGGELIAQVKAPRFSIAAGTYTEAQSVTLTSDTGATIYYTVDGTEPTTSSSTYSTALNISETTTVKAFAAKGGISSKVVTVEYTINANANDGSLSKPYTASEAAELALAGNTSTVHVKGYISSIVEPYSSYENTSFNISEDGKTTTTQFEIFRVAASSATDYMVGDYVVFQGTLKNYNGVAEFEAGSTKIMQVKAPRFSPNGGNFSGDSQTVTLTADSGSEIHYTIGETLPTSTTGTVYSEAITLTATTTINALAVKDGIVTGVVSKTFTKIAGADVQFVVDDFDGLGTANTGSEMSVTKSGITFACDKGYGTTQIRCYKGSTITISAESGKTITGISFVFSGSYNGGLNNSYTNLSTSSWSSGELGSQARLMSITVTYE